MMVTRHFRSLLLCLLLPQIQTRAMLLSSRYRPSVLDRSLRQREKVGQTVQTTMKKSRASALERFV